MVAHLLIQALCFGCVVLAVRPAGSAESSNKGTMMRDKSSLADELRLIDEDHLDSYAAKLRKMKSIPYNQLVDLWFGNDADLAGKAIWVILELGGNQAVPEVLDKMDEATPEMKASAILFLSQHKGGGPKKIEVKLRKLLSDTTPIPQRAIRRPVEERPAKMRICDEAYIALRSMKRKGHPYDEAVNQRLFSKLTFSERDQEIQKTLHGEPFTDFQNSPPYADPQP